MASNYVKSIYQNNYLEVERSILKKTHELRWIYVLSDKKKHMYFQYEIKIKQEIA